MLPLYIFSVCFIFYFRFCSVNVCCPLRAVLCRGVIVIQVKWVKASNWPAKGVQVVCLCLAVDNCLHCVILRTFVRLDVVSIIYNVYSSIQ